MTGPVLLITESGFGPLLEESIAEQGPDSKIADLLCNPEVALLVHWSDFLPELSTRGVEAGLVILGNRTLQRSAERDLGLPESASETEHLRIRLQHSRPRTVLFASHQGFHRHASLVRRELDSMPGPTAKIGFHATYSGALGVDTSPDFVLAATPGIARSVGRLGVRTELWYLQIPSVGLLDEAKSKLSETKLSFVGNTGFWDSRYRWRATVLGSLIDSGFPIAVHHFGPSEPVRIAREVFVRRALASAFPGRPLVNISKPLLRSKAARAALAESEHGFRPERPSLASDVHLLWRISGWRTSNIDSSRPGMVTARILQNHPITINAHQDPIADVGNMRMFEATAYGVCLLTDAGKNLHHLFEEDREVIAYRTVGEARSKAKYLLENPSVAADIAAAGHRRYLSSHTPACRADELIGLGVLA